MDPRQAPPVNRFEELPNEVTSLIMNNSEIDLREVSAIRASNRYFREFARNALFVAEFNQRQRTPVWICGHCLTSQHPKYGVLYGIRLTDGRRMVRPIPMPQPIVPLPLPNHNRYFISATFLEVSRSNFLFLKISLLQPHSLLVVNPFEGTSQHINLPPHFPQNILALPHLFSIHTDSDTSYQIVCIIIRENSPQYYNYTSGGTEWAIFRHPIKTDSKFKNFSNTFQVLDVGARSLYTLYLPSGVRAQNAYYRRSNIINAFNLAENRGLGLSSTVVYFGQWVILYRYTDWPHNQVRFHSAYLFRQDHSNNPYNLITVIPLPSQLTRLNAFANLSGKVIQGFVYIYVQTLGNVASEDPEPSIFVLRFNIADEKWIPCERYPFPAIGGHHFSPLFFTDRLILMPPDPNRVDEQEPAVLND